MNELLISLLQLPVEDLENIAKSPSTLTSIVNRLTGNSDENQAKSLASTTAFLSRLSRWMAENELRTQQETFAKLPKDHAVYGDQNLDKKLSLLKIILSNQTVNKAENDKFNAFANAVILSRELLVFKDFFNRLSQLNFNNHSSEFEAKFSIFISSLSLLSGSARHMDQEFYKKNLLLTLSNCDVLKINFQRLQKLESRLTEDKPVYTVFLKHFTSVQRAEDIASIVKSMQEGLEKAHYFTIIEALTQLLEHKKRFFADKTDEEFNSYLLTNKKFKTLDFKRFGVFVAISIALNKINKVNGVEAKRLEELKKGLNYFLILIGKDRIVAPQQALIDNYEWEKQYKSALSERNRNLDSYIKAADAEIKIRIKRKEYSPEEFFGSDVSEPDKVEAIIKPEPERKLTFSPLEVESEIIFQPPVARARKKPEPLTPEVSLKKEPPAPEPLKVNELSVEPIISSPPRVEIPEKTDEEIAEIIRKAKSTRYLHIPSFKLFAPDQMEDISFDKLNNFLTTESNNLSAEIARNNSLLLKQFCEEHGFSINVTEYPTDLHRVIYNYLHQGLLENRFDLFRLYSKKMGENHLLTGADLNILNMFLKNAIQHEPGQTNEVLNHHVSCFIEEFEKFKRAQDSYIHLQHKQSRMLLVKSTLQGHNIAGHPLTPAEKISKIYQALVLDDMSSTHFDHFRKYQNTYTAFTGKLPNADLYNCLLTIALAIHNKDTAELMRGMQKLGALLTPDYRNQNRVYIEKFTSSRLWKIQDPEFYRVVRDAITLAKGNLGAFSNEENANLALMLDGFKFFESTVVPNDITKIVEANTKIEDVEAAINIATNTVLLEKKLVEVINVHVECKLFLANVIKERIKANNGNISNVLITNPHGSGVISLPVEAVVGSLFEPNTKAELQNVSSQLEARQKELNNLMNDDPVLRTAVIKYGAIVNMEDTLRKKNTTTREKLETYATQFQQNSALLNKQLNYDDSGWNRLLDKIRGFIASFVSKVTAPKVEKDAKLIAKMHAARTSLFPARRLAAREPGIAARFSLRSH